MSSKFRLISIFALIVLLGSLAGAISAQDTPPATKDDAAKAQKLEQKGFGRRGERGKRIERNLRGFHGFRGIELTDSQKDQIRKIRESNRPDPAVMEELKAIHEAHRSGTITEDQKARVKALREQMRTKAASVREQMLGVLTAEQRQQLETRTEEMRKKMEERRRLRQTKPISADPKNDN